MKAFSCPQCGSHDYTLLLSGCTVTNATLQETFGWNADSQEYESIGTIMTESDEVTPSESQAFCAGCEANVTEAVALYEASLEQSAEAAS